MVLKYSVAVGKLEFFHSELDFPLFCLVIQIKTKKKVVGEHGFNASLNRVFKECKKTYHNNVKLILLDVVKIYTLILFRKEKPEIIMIIDWNHFGYFMTADFFIAHLKTEIQYN